MKAKKHLGQHFLTDQGVVNKIIQAILDNCSVDIPLLEVGPGKGVLTMSLSQYYPTFRAIEFDRDMVAILKEELDGKQIINKEFLGFDLDEIFEKREFNLVGNFPYNISSQIIFKMLDNVERIPVMVGMFQKEVAERICADPGSKKNGILSLRTQAYYEGKILFDISPDAFSPPPRVNSSVIMLSRLEKTKLNCDPDLYSRLIKMAFQQRRKKLRNTLKSQFENLEGDIFHKRPEELSVEEFVNLTIEAQNQK